MFDIKSRREMMASKLDSEKGILSWGDHLLCGATNYCVVTKL